tara:strand:+ start:710 stop:1255 length:546 start_codon:yes stop_codon:yes gene_type:complete
MPVTTTKVVNLYTYEDADDELKKKIIENYYDINVDHQWWDFTYDDAKQIGLIIEGFDIDRGNICEGKLEYSLSETCENIHKEHGEDCTCETSTLATNALKEWSELVAKHSEDGSSDTVAEENEVAFDDEADELERNFEQELLEHFLGILRREYEYQTEEEQIIETLKANEYTFNEQGKIDS